MNNISTVLLKQLKELLYEHSSTGWAIWKFSPEKDIYKLDKFLKCVGKYEVQHTNQGDSLFDYEAILKENYDENFRIQYTFSYFSMTYNKKHTKILL